MFRQLLANRNNSLEEVERAATYCFYTSAAVLSGVGAWLTYKFCQQTTEIRALEQQRRQETRQLVAAEEAARIHRIEVSNTVAENYLSQAEEEKRKAEQYQKILKEEYGVDVTSDEFKAVIKEDTERSQRRRADYGTIFHHNPLPDREIQIRHGQAVNSELHDRVAKMEEETITQEIAAAQLLADVRAESAERDREIECLRQVSAIGMRR